MTGDGHVFASRNADSQRQPDPHSGARTSRTHLELDSGWSQARWIKILDRIEHRQPDVGLRFWGPPLWLEVTMVGPDSDSWPIINDENAAWDWQSSAPCVEVAALAHNGADDDRLLAVVSRYTIENLILNAVHEIGEWLRFDGRRLFPAHNPGGTAPSDRDAQGNGAVTLHLQFGQAAHLTGPTAAAAAPDHQRNRQLVSRLAERVAPSRFTYLPGTTISYEAPGPVIWRWSDGEAPIAWRSSWSSATLQAAAADAPDVVAFVGRDIHSALVLHEADRICRAFHVDGTRPWNLSVADCAHGAGPPDTDAPDAELLTIMIGYADTTDAATVATGSTGRAGTGGLLRHARRAVDAARADDVFLHAAALAFYGLISVAPLVIVALWVTTLIVGAGQVHHVADHLARLAPPALGADRALQRVANLSTTLGLVAVASALWPATAYGAGLVRVLDRVTGHRRGAGLRGRGAALLLVCLLPVLVLGSLVAGYAGAATLGRSPTHPAVSLSLGLILSFAVTVAVVALIYKIFPRSPPTWRNVLRGALIAAAIIAVLSVSYVAYLRMGANFEQRYASDALASVVLLGVWLYSANIALLVGYRVARREARPEGEPPQRGGQSSYHPPLSAHT